MEGQNFTFTPQLALILGGIAGLLIGWVIGFFDSNNRTAKKIQIAEETAKAAKEESDRKIAFANKQTVEAQEKAALFAETPQDDPGLLRLKNNNGQYQLQMDGAVISGALTPDRKKRLIDLLTAIRPYLEGATPPQTPIPAAPQPPLQTPPRHSPVIQETFVPPAPPPPVEPIPAIIRNPFAKKTETKPDANPFTSLSMVAQIDYVLQEQLITSPLANRGIRLAESRDGGVEVYIGDNKFATIEDVPDATVKAAIRAAIAKWEKKATPGG